MTVGFVGSGFSVQVAFNDNVWATSPTWTDITRYVIGPITTAVGRPHENQQVTPSTAVIPLWNGPTSHGDTTGGRFSPWNSGSPYYNSGNGLTPGHPIRIRQTISATTYNVFYGYTQSWVPSYGQSKSTVTLNCYDGMALANLAMMDANLYAPQVLADGATAYWECQGNFFDATGNGHTGTQVGSVSFSNPGALLAVTDGCAAFGGGGLMGTPITPAAVSHVMFEGWFDTSLPDQTFMSWAVGATAGNVEAVSLCTNSVGRPVLAYGATSVVPPATGVFVTGPNGTDDGRWHHYVVQVPCTDVTATWTLYVDGVLAGSGNTGFGTFGWTGVSSPINTFTAAGYWFENNTGGAGTTYQLFGLSGAMDQVAYYQTPLSAAQVANHYQLGSAGFVVQDSGSRAQAVLESLVGIPSGLVNCQTGVTQVAAATSALNQTTAISYLQQIVNTERGILYQDATGVFQFKNREYVYTNSTSVNSQVTFTYHVGSGQQFFSTGIVPAEDDQDVFNDWPVGRQGGVVQYASDATSITKYGRRSGQGYTSLLFTNDVDAENLAGGLLYQYKNPATRVRAIQTSSTINAGANLASVLALNLLDRVTIVWKPIDGSSVDFSQPSLVEQISHTISPGQWNTTLAVTPIGTETFGLWNTAVWNTSIWGF